MPSLLQVKELPSGIVGKRPTQADFANVLKSRRSALQSLIIQLNNGVLTIAEFGDEFYTVLLDGHTDAWVLGRQLSGDLSRLGPEDQLIARGIADGQSEFLNGFLNSLENDPRYRYEDGTFNIRIVSNRSDMYVSNMRATSAKAFTETSDSGEEFNWVLGAVEEHCSDCPELASISPWTADTLFTHPGEGDTPCLTNCKCHLVRISDGISSFKPVDLIAA